MTEQIKVGDVLWSRAGGRWVPGEIVGETRQSWIVADSVPFSKVLKRTLRQNCGAYGYDQYYTEQGKADLEWLSKHRFAIESRVKAVPDVATLKQIAALVGYEP